MREEKNKKAVNKNRNVNYKKAGKSQEFTGKSAGTESKRESTRGSKTRKIKAVVKSTGKMQGNPTEKSQGKTSGRFSEDTVPKPVRREVRGHKNNSEFCPYFRRCGGCSYQGVSYESQLKEKQKQVEELLAPYCKVQPIIGMKNPLHYRNKVAAAFGRLRNGTIISGVYEGGTHRIVNVDSCMIENEKADAIIGTIKGLLKSFKIKVYDEDSRYGLLRHVLVRTAHVTGEIMVVLVLASPILPSKNNFVKALRKEHPEITTVILNVNDKHTSMVLGEKESVIYGKGYIEDVLCGVTFRISSRSFYQVNSVQTEILYQKAIDMAKLTGKEKIIDAYCGIGTIGLIASKKAKEVISVELNRDAVKDAVANARKNQIQNVTFYQADAGEFMTQMASQGAKADVVFMDPPRSGSDEAFMSSVVKLGPEKVVYISCNPETLARDLGYFTKNGYRVERGLPIDQFPFTNHVESVALMSRVDK